METPPGLTNMSRMNTLDAPCDNSIRNRGYHCYYTTRLPAEKLDIAMVVGDGGPLVDQRDGKVFSQVRGIAGHEGRAG